MRARKITPLFEVPADLSTLPDPPVPEGLDLRHFDSMHLNTTDLLESSIWDECSDAEIATALRLWAKAWQQVPCASLPNDAAKIREWAGCAGKNQRWKVVASGALRGFFLCKDGRLYHHKVAASANSAASLSRRGKRGADARWEKVNALKENKSSNTQAHANGHAKHHAKPHGQTDAEKGRDNSSPLPPSLDTLGPAAAPDGTAGPATARTRPQPAQPEYVEVEMPTRAKVRITAYGAVDEVWTPRDCPQTALTPAEAKALYAKTVAAMGVKPAVVQANPDAPPPTEKEWDAIAAAFVKSGRKKWPTHTKAGFPLGPSPDEPGCFCPRVSIKAAELNFALTQPEMQTG